MDGERTVRGETRDGGEIVGGVRTRPSHVPFLHMRPPGAHSARRPANFRVRHRSPRCVSIDFSSSSSPFAISCTTSQKSAPKDTSSSSPTRPARTCRCAEVQPSAGLRPRREQETPLEPPSPSRRTALGSPALLSHPHQGRCPRSQCMTSNNPRLLPLSVGPCCSQCAAAVIESCQPRLRSERALPTQL
ncbi:hypothetical protein OH76DRAFT_1057800 [Lentinus brumalis]|uniref:Uncharacterized protein n=1 Tax=Lentinus brumalis TaxID=2498619 RepID=A0A371DNE4_9APHY|nr:hypothetical protein OH76DRAFT_1057800 [Polyporus brumalis]